MEVGALVREAVAVGVRLGVWVRVAVTEAVKVPSGVEVELAVGRSVAVEEGTKVALGRGVGVEVGVGVIAPGNTWIATGPPNNAEATVEENSTSDKRSHCQPASM